MRYITVLLVLAMSAFTSFSQKTLKVTSPSFTDKGTMPAKYSCDGRESSPPLRIDNIPSDAKSLALTLHDLDAPYVGGFTHWVVWNVDVMNDIPENYTGGTKGVNSIAKHKYTGVCPSGPHRFEFKVYALDTKMNLDLNTDKGTLEKKMRGHVLAEGKLIGMYERTSNISAKGAEEKMNR